jgi:hypothetical protein
VAFPDLTGKYTLTIAAAGHCGDGLGEGNVPEEARKRVYAATIDQDGPWLGVSLAAWTLYFGGSFDLDRSVVIKLANLDDGQPIVEELSLSRHLIIEGTATVVGSADGLAGTLSGEFLVFARFDAPPIARCTSNAHQFVLERTRS